MKTKRLIALILSVVMTLSCGGIEIVFAAAGEKVVWEENFDKLSDINSVNTISKGGDGIAELVNDSDYGKSIRFITGFETGSKASWSQKFSNVSEAGTVSFSIKYANSNDWTSIYFGSSLNLYLNNGTIGSHIGSSTPAHRKIGADAWHDVDVNFDIPAGKYDVYVDYEKVASGVSLRNATAFSSMTISVDKIKNNVTFDNFKITSKPSKSKATEVKDEKSNTETDDKTTENKKEMITAADGESITVAKLDTFVTTNGKSAMKGYDNSIAVTRDNASGETQAFLKFDAPSVPDGKRAYLNLYMNSASYATAAEPFSVYAVDNNWDETLGSGEARPVILDTAGRKIFANDAANNWVKIDITDYIARNSGSEISLSLRGDSVDASAAAATTLNFDSREGICKPNIIVCEPIKDVEINPTVNENKNGSAIDLSPLVNVSEKLSSGKGINMYAFGTDLCDIETYGAFARALADKSGAKVNYINKGLKQLGGANSFADKFYNLTEDQTIDLAVIEFSDINETTAKNAIDKLRMVNRYAEVIFVTDNPIAADGAISVKRSDIDSAVIGNISFGAVKSYVAEPNMKYNLKQKEEKDIVDYVSFDNFADGDIGDGILFDNQRDYIRVEDDKLCGGKVLRYKKDTAHGNIATKWFGTSVGGNLRFDIQMCFYSTDTKFTMNMFPTARDSGTVMDTVTFGDGVLNIGGQSMEVNANQWYNLALLYDLDAHSYDVIVDGAVFVQGAATKQTTGTICSYEIDVAAGNTADFAIDSMRTGFYTDAEKPRKEVTETVEEDDGPAVIFDNDLESVPVGLISQGTSGDVSYVREDGNTFVRATRTKGNGTCTTNFSFPQTKGDVSLELDFRLGNINGATKLLYLNDTSGKFSVPIYFSGDKMQLNLSSNDRPIVMSGLEAQKWYHVRIITNLEKQTYSIELDGTTVSPDGGYKLLNQPVSGFKSFRISISAGEDSSYDVDNFYIQRLNTMSGDTKMTAAGYNPNNDAPNNNEWINKFRRNPTGEIYEAENMLLNNYEVYTDLNFSNQKGVRVASTGCGTAEFIYNGDSGYKRIDVGYLEENGKIDSRFYLYQNGKLIDWWLAQNDEVGRYNRNSKDYWYVNNGDKFMIRGAYGADPSELDYVEFSDGAKRDFRFGDLVGDVNRAPGYWLSSSWDADNAGGVVSQTILFRDTSSHESVTAERRLTGFNSPFVIEYYYQQFAKSKYKMVVGNCVGNNEKYPISIEFDGYDITVGGNRYSDVIKHGGGTYLRIAADPETKTFAVIADSKAIAENIPFDGSVSEFNIIKIITDKDTESYFRVYPFAVKAGYALIEDFRCESANGIELYNWSVAGNKPTFVVTDNAENCDPFHRGIPSGTAISKKFGLRSGKITYETQIMFPKTHDGARVAIGSDDGEIALFTKNGGIWYDAGNGNAALVWDKYKENVWYEFKFEIDFSAGKCDFFVNSFKKVSAQIKLAKADTVKLSAGSGEIWVDDIAVFDGFYNDDNEAPALEIPQGYGDYNIVMQTCDMWREGTHFGYDALHPFAARTPFLGYLEEGSPEACDWETKWMVEHGVNVFAPCWYMPNDANSAPKNPRNGYRLDQGFMNSKFHDDIKYSINLTYAGVTSGEENFLKYYVPYWIEHYFKDPSYFVVDNKPVIFIFNVAEFSNEFGNDGTARVLDKVREMCRAEGFDGAIFAITRENTSSVSGWDYSYAYTLGGSEDGYTALKNAYDYEDSNYIFTASQGFGAEAWGRSQRKLTLPVKDFKADLEWARDVYLPANADDPLLGTTISLDNWNEYCEGHTLAPSNHAGFEYLDMVREVFTKSPSEHTDIIPEKRFDQMAAMLW